MPRAKRKMMDETERKNREAAGEMSTMVEDEMMMGREEMLPRDLDDMTPQERAQMEAMRKRRMHK